MSQQLYGREAEKQALANAYRRTCFGSHRSGGLVQEREDVSLPTEVQSGTVSPEHLTLSTFDTPALTADSSFSFSELVLLTGPSGAGKSRLARELKAHVVADGGFFCRGKFEALESAGKLLPLCPSNHGLFGAIPEAL